MVYLPDDASAGRQRKTKRLGWFQFAAILVGLPLLLLLFRPTAVSLAISLALAALGAWNGFREARSGRLDLAMPPSPSAQNKASRQVFPIIALLGIVVGSLVSGQWAGAVAAVLFFFAGVAVGITASNALHPSDEPAITHSTPTSSDMGFFDFGKPQWAKGLPPHIQLTATQLKELEAVRAGLGEQHQAFHWHIATHPESTKMLQRSIYQMLKLQYPKASDSSLLARMIWMRLMTAIIQGQDLFGLSKKVAISGAEPTADNLDTIVTYLNQRKLFTLEAVADAIVQEEEQLPDNIPPAPQARAAVQRVTEILRQSS